MGFLNWLAAGAILLFILFIGIFAGGTQVALSPTQTSAPATSTIASSTIPVVTLQNLFADVATSTSVKPKVTVKKAPPAVAAGGVVPVSPPPPTVLLPPLPPVITQSDFDSASTALRAALVNILCISQNSGLQSISGSGVIVDPRGTILTNAHIAQYFLLSGNSSFQASCTIRVGSPARSTYLAKLMFISPAWLHANSKVLSQTRPTGNGEYDFALLSITSAATNDPLPATLPFVPLEYGAPSVNEPVVIGSYAAQFLTGSEIQSALFPTIVFGSIKNIYTFRDTTVDVFSLGGSAAAQEGSSGGGVVNTNGRLIGTITTSTVEGDTSTRNLSAITENYIERDYLAETGTTLATLFAQTPAQAVAAFSDQIPALQTLITAH